MKEPCWWRWCCNSWCCTCDFCPDRIPYFVGTRWTVVRIRLRVGQTRCSTATAWGRSDEAWWKLMEREREERARERASERERSRERERERERWREKKIEGERGFETYKELFCTRKSKKQYFWNSQKPKTAILESQRQLFSKLCLRRKKTIKKTKKVSFLSCFESQKELFLKLKNNYFWDCFWDSKKLVLLVFYSVLSFFPFCWSIKSS